LRSAGAKGIFGPGTPIQTAAREVLAQVRKARAG
jgi:methylmalonyl-CoA mutase